MLTLLYLAANPLDGCRLRFDQEHREITEATGDALDVKSMLAVRAQDLHEVLFKTNPTIVHLTAHGDEGGSLLLEDVSGDSVPITAEALAELFRLFEHVRCVVLSYCDSCRQAQSIAQHVDAVVGMSESISDGAARSFAIGFYRAIAKGRDIASAFDFGRNQIQLDQPGEEHIPQLRLRDKSFCLHEKAPQETQQPKYVQALVLRQSARAIGLIPTEHLTLIPSLVTADPPPPGQRLSPRTQTLARIQAALGSKTWYAVYGGIGTGKTQLARLFAAARTGLCLWIRLRNTSPTEALDTIDATLSSVRLPLPNQRRAAWYRDVCIALGPEAVIVLDDFPQTSGREMLDDALIFLADGARHARTLLISTTARVLPPGTSATRGTALLQEESPPLLDSEIAEIFAAYGAPPSFLSTAWVGMVATVCRQHPVLLTEAVQFLAAKEWQAEIETFQDLVSGRYATNLDAPTRDDVKRTVVDPATRELLYRLTLINGSFSDDHVRDIAAVAPAIDHPSERIDSLLGLWIQRDGQNHYVTSPLTSRLGSANLTKTTEQAVHNTVATKLVKQESITLRDAIQAVHHFVAAERFKSAGLLFLRVLRAAQLSTTSIDDMLLLFFWSHTPLPDHMPIGLRIGIRTSQISLFNRAKKDVRYLASDLEQLLGSEVIPDELHPLRLMAGGILALATLEDDPLRATRLIVQIINELRDEPARIFGVRKERMRRGYCDLLWATTAKLSTNEQVTQWLGLVAALQPEGITAWMQSREADIGAELLCNNVWMREQAKPQDQQNWSTARDTLSTVEAWARQRHAIPILAWAVWGEVVVLAEYQDAFDEAIILGKSALDECADHPSAPFWLMDILGRQHYYKHRWEDAFHWFRQCVNSSAPVDAHKRVMATLHAGIVAAHLKHNDARAILTAAARTADENATTIPSRLAAMVHAEVALEHWRHDERTLTFRHWSCAAELLLGAPLDDDTKISISIFDNFSGYLVYVASGNDPKRWEFARPKPGIMFEQLPALVEDYDPAKAAIIPAHLAHLAEALDLFADAMAWASRATVTGFFPGLRSQLATYRVAAYIVAGDVLAAFEEAHAAYYADVGASDVKARIDYVRYEHKSSMLTICFALAKEYLIDQQRAQASVARLSERIQALPEQREPFLHAIGDAIQGIVSGQQHYLALYKQATAWGKREETQLDCVYRLMALLQAPPTHALQLTAVSFRRQFMRWMSPTQYCTVVIPFLRAYWRWASEHYAPHFSAPRMLQANLCDAMETTGEEGLDKDLDHVALSLGIKLSSSNRL